MQSGINPTAENTESDIQLVSYQYFVIDALGERKPLENFTEKLEHLSSVLCFHLTLKPIHLIHVICLMVTFTKQNDNVYLLHTKHFKCFWEFCWYNIRKLWCVLTPKQVEVFWIEQLEAKKCENDFYRERATVHKVTIEQLRS